jgi:hypothetical protein
MEGFHGATQGQQQGAPRKIKVYKFTRFNEATGEHFTSRIYATQEAIKRIDDAAILSNSALEVDPSVLASNGSYEPSKREQQIRASLRPKENQF